MLGTPKPASSILFLSFFLGKIGKHSVVSAVLPDSEYGTDSAAGCKRHAAQLSKHQNWFNVNGLKAQYEEEGHQLEEAINKILKKNQRLRQKYKRPDPRSDRLYKAEVTHPPDSDMTCAAVCRDDPSKLIVRHERTESEDNPKIHYGLIASANQLMKDALIRDALAQEKDVLCFEMEAAGLMNHFPCLVIRGICDYSDSHKNKEWQGYAAMAAAAYAKDILCQLPPTRVEAEKRINDILSSVTESMSKVQVTTQDTNIIVKKLCTEYMRDKIERWLSPPDPSADYNKALQQRHKDSGLWFLHGDVFAKWKKRPNSFLWLHGIPGCRKTILSSAIIQDLEETTYQPVLYFYFNFNDISKQSLDSMIRSLISQLYNKQEDIREQLNSLFSSCEDGRRQPTTESLNISLRQMIQQVGEVWIVLDALDECNTRKETEALLLWIKCILDSELRNVHLIVTSRPEQDIESAISEWARTEDMIAIQKAFVTNDIREYVRTKIREDEGLKRWRSIPEVQDEIENRLMEKADGMFRWAACQVEALKSCLDYPELREALASLPDTLDETYARILNSIPRGHKQKAIRILQFLSFSNRSLLIEEAVDAIAVDPEGVPRFDPKNRMPVPREISRYCSSLVVVVNRKKHWYDQNDQDIPVQRIREIFPLAQYCAEYWMHHAAIGEGRDKVLQRLIMEFFSLQ
ncbi:Uncharacterized protein T310_6236 [Rasamsonia emersonii CBS 393.64]|uniref:Nephrocystin 3-like N-terminal domain-containing protein n=1 Tax=Rasamsonia emersonii (strain ATCC 16479 / CBS 393.64 / IMI 116815) TaxID=1408163 RepID=A0A0F4YNV8_RASE3|nr:Uncharacterized protein T310_6236 [Rasamsonia emersonii CBS 393.64]KKA19770.1 Uncharacterized protein T310_6236 [Rasamsonia emersonii CBS 393.64]